MPQARHTLEFVDFVTAMVKRDRLHFGNLVGVIQLFWSQFVVKFPSVEKLLQTRTVGDFYCRTFWELRFVWTFAFSHDIIAETTETIVARNDAQLPD